MIIGVPSLRRRDVSYAPPLEVSTVTEGTCAEAIAETSNARLNKNVLIIFICYGYLH
jgi:hypothetical protein